MTGQRDVFEQAMRQGHSAAWDQQWDRAIAHYSAALNEFPDDANALPNLGLALLNADRLEEALKTYQRAAALQPGDPVAPEKCGEIFERLGRVTEAAQTFMVVADIHLTRRDVHKAIDNWSRVVRLTPDNLNAHSRLALACERSGRVPQAVREYIEVARIFQRARDTERAMQAASRAQQLDPQSPEVRDALDKIRRGVPLPVPDRPRGTTGMLKPVARADFAPVQEPPPEAEAPPAPEKSASPLTAAESVALGKLAELLFEEDTDVNKPMGTSGLARARGLLGGAGKRAQALVHLGQAINSQSGGAPEDAVAHYEKALRAGLDHPMLRFVLGVLYLDLERPRDAVKAFTPVVRHDEMGVGALFGIGQAHTRLRETRLALTALLEALKRLDQQLAPPDSQEALAEAYEGITEQLARASDAEAGTIAAGLTEFLSGEGWEERLQLARRQLDSASDDGQVMPLADLLAVPGADRVVESMRRIDLYMKRQYWAAAMEEAYAVLTHSPTHLPVHIRMAEILRAENKTEAALAKYAVVAETYRIRGEPGRAARLIQEVLRLNPLDVAMRSRLIELLVEQRRVEDALQQFIELGSTYYQLADLEAARSTYADALILAQQSNVDRSWSVRLLHQIGDIDLQRLNWREAQQAYEQIKSLAPEDHGARAALVDLLYRLGENAQAVTEIDSYLRILLTAGQAAKAIQLLEELAQNHPQEMPLIARLARLYQDSGRREEAIGQFDRLGELQLEAGQNRQAAESIRAILALGPADPATYQQLLKQIQT